MTETREQSREKYLKKSIKDGEIFIEDNRITYVKARTKKEYDYSDPEEKVRALVYAELIYRYQYSSKDLELELKIELQPDDKFADITIYYPKDKKKIFAIIEVKKEKVSKKEIVKAINEQYSYAIIKDAQYFVFDCNKSKERKSYAIYGYDGDPNKKWGQKERVQNIVHDLPIKYGEVKEWNYIKGDKEHSLIPISNNELYEIFKKCHDILWEGGKKDPAEAFDEMSKIIFVKSMDEYKTKKREPYKFQIGNHETNDKLGIANRIRKFFEEVKVDKEHVFMEDVEEDEDGKPIKHPSKIKSRNDRIYKIVSLIQGIDLKNTDLDAKGRAFEQFLDTVFKSKLGQYFTHRNIVNFCVQVLDPKESEFILDPSCGSGGFLLYSLVHVREKLKEGYNLEDANDREEFKQKYKEFAENHLYGIEKNEKIARVAMMDMVIYEDGSTNIENNDGLVDFSLYKNEKIKGGKGKFNLILTNPPFGAKVDFEELDNFKDFRLGGESRNQQASDILFIERNLDFLVPDFSNPLHKTKDGGRIAIVLPDGILNNSSLWYVRQLIQESSFVRAIVSLPNFAFKKTGSGSKTSLVFLKKFTINEKKKYLKDKESHLPDKIEKLKKMKALININLFEFISENEIEKKLESMYPLIMNVHDEFSEKIKIITEKVEISKDDGSKKEVERITINRDNMENDTVEELIKQVQELFKKIEKKDYCFDESEEEQMENLLRYYDEVMILGKFFSKFLETAQKIIERTKTDACSIKIKKPTKKLPNRQINIEIKDEKSYAKMLSLLTRYSGKKKFTDEEIVELLEKLKAYKDQLHPIKNPLWISTASQVNDKNILTFLKYCGLDILKEFQKEIRQLEIQQENIDFYTPDFEAHKEVMKDWDYPIFMAIADKIGYDSTGRLDKNELYREEWIGDEDIKTKLIDSTDEDTILGQWHKFKADNDIDY